MTNLIIIGVSLVAGLVIGGGIVLMWINQRKIPLDPYTDRYRINENDLAYGTTIGILDAECANVEICQVTMLEYEKDERVRTAQWVQDALNRHRG